MNIKLEALRGHITDYIHFCLEDFEIDADAIVNSVAIEMLSEIQAIIQKEDYSDFQAIEEIVRVFEKHKIDFGTRHDF